MNESNNKHNRMQQLKILLKTHSEGLRKAEIARRLGVHRSTVGRYIDELSLSMPIWERYSLIGLEKKSDIDSEPQFTAVEGAFLLSLVKLYEQELNIKNPHASSVIRKFSEEFKNAAPVLSAEFLATADRLDNEESRFSKGSIENYEKMLEAWIYGRSVSLSYLHKSTGESCSTIYEPAGFYVCKNGSDSSDLAVKGICIRTGGSCPLRLMDFIKMVAPVAEIDIENNLQNRFCPISEFALGNRPFLKNDRHEDLNLKEANHRIKNSLFMASSLVDITLSDIKDQDVQDKAKKLQSRIDTIALVHEQLSFKHGADAIWIDRYLSNLIDRTLNILSIDGIEVVRTLKIDAFQLPSNVAVPLGMIISELVTNSFKHSLKDNTKVIRISISKTNGVVRLRYSDGGEGFRLGANGSTGGIDIIQRFCKQLHCTMTYKNNNFILEFPV